MVLRSGGFHQHYRRLAGGFVRRFLQGVSVRNGQSPIRHPQFCHSEFRNPQFRRSLRQTALARTRRAFPSPITFTSPAITRWVALAYAFLVCQCARHTIRHCPAHGESLTFLSLTSGCGICTWNKTRRPFLSNS